MEESLQQHSVVFEEGLGTYTGPNVNLRIRPESVPKFCKVRPVPDAQREAVEQKLIWLEAEGIIELVQQSEKGFSGGYRHKGRWIDSFVRGL